MSEIHEERGFESTTDLKIYSTWEEMKLKPELLQQIAKLKWAKPSPIQSRAIVPISKGKSMVLQSQNGTGKTATFSIGALQRLEMKTNFTELIILSPTREIAIQSRDTLRNLGANARDCVGGNSLGEDVKALKNGVHCVSGTPGRILQLIREHNIDASHIKAIVIDEADEMLMSLKRTLISILEICREYKPQIIVVTATVSEEVEELYAGFLLGGLKLLVPRDELILSQVDQFVVRVNEERWKFDSLCDLYQSVAIERAVIFVNTKEKGDWLKQKLVTSGFTVSLVHSQLSQEERNTVTQDFKSGETRVLIATDVLSRGFDVRNITLVINFDIPTDTRTYYHRIGRSGRFGRKGVAITFCAGNSDEKKLKKLEEYYRMKIKDLPSDLDSLFF